MRKKKKIRLSTLVVICFAVSLFLVTLSYSIITLRSIRNIGNYAVRIEEKNLLDISSNLFLEITRRTALEYAAYFKDAEEITQIMARQIGKYNFTPEALNEPINNPDYLKLEKYKNTDFFVSDKNSKITAFYWGKHDQNGVPENVTKEINSLNKLTPIFSGFMKYSKDYFTSFWLHGRNDYMFMYPKSDLYYKNMKNRKMFKEYFSVFEIISDHDMKAAVIKPFWLKPYRDVTGTTISSVFTPVYDKEKNIIAVVGLDLDLDNLLNSMLASRLLIEDSPEKEYLANNPMIKNNLFEGFLFITDIEGNILAFPKEYTNLFELSNNFVIKKKDQFYKRRLLDSENPEVKQLGKKIIKTKFGIELIKLKGSKYFVAYSRLEGTDFILGFVVSEKALMSSVEQTSVEMNRIEVSAIKHGLLISLIVLIVSIVVFLLFFRKYLFHPIETFRRKVRKMGEGRFNIRFKEEGILEITELGSTFNYLGKELLAYTDNLKKEITARQQIESEVKIAANLQLSMLPKIDKSFINEDFSLAAKLSPAKDASGDYYDFFYLEENRIVLIIADVAGKGISAAFYMGMVKTLLKNICFQEKDDPSKALNRVNRILSHDNSTLMFVTLFVGYYDIDTGKMLFANAGHHEAICVGENGVYRKFGMTKGIAIGITEQRKYRTNKTIINKGDTVVLYTDGVIEAVNPEEEDFGDERFKKLLVKNRMLSCDDLAENIIKNVRAFEHQKRYDDLTVLILKRN